MIIRLWIFVSGTFSSQIVALDIRRDGKEVEHDLLPYSDLCNQALAGRLAGVGGGTQLPNMEHPSLDPQPRSTTTFAWSERMKASDQQLVDDDSILLLRQMVITHLGKGKLQLPAPWNFLERPVDPKHNSTAPSAWRCSSIWATRALRTWHHLLQHLDHLRPVQVGTSGKEVDHLDLDYQPPPTTLAGYGMWPWPGSSQTKQNAHVLGP